VRFHNLAAEQAVEIMSVEGEGPARAAGLREGDLVVAIDEQPVATVDDLHRYLAEWPIGRPLGLTVLRGQERFEVMVKPAETH
jgi:S1-C subfamily serine protease